MAISFGYLLSFIYVTVQLAAINKMIAEGKNYSDIFVQLRSVESAFRKSIVETCETEHRLELAERIVEELEEMFSLCANCKKYRTDDGKWFPIEKYLIDSGTPKLTHGCCPECTEKLYGGILNKK